MNKSLWMLWLTACVGVTFCLAILVAEKEVVLVLMYSIDLFIGASS